MITALFVCLYNACIVRIVLLRIKGWKILVKKFVFVKDRAHQVVEEIHVWLVTVRIVGLHCFSVTESTLVLPGWS